MPENLSTTIHSVPSWAPAPHHEAPPGPSSDPRESCQDPPDQPWQALLDSAGEGILGVDMEGRCTFVNRAALKMLGFEAPDLIGRNLHAMIHHHHTDGRAYLEEDGILDGVLRHRYAFTNEIDHLFRKDGSHFYTEMSAQPIVQNGEARGAVVTFRDITKARLAEQALRRSEKLAAVGQLSSSIAHEINNPLEAVLNLVYLVRSAPTLEEARSYASLAEVELIRVADITMQTLRFHRKQNSTAPVDLEDTISAILRLYSARFPARRIRVEQRFAPSPQPLLLESDIRQVLNNLIRNSYDAMQSGGGSLHLRLRPATCPLTGMRGVRITVADTGTGFLPAMRGHLFEPFQTTKEVTGTGLGLWITKGIIDKHDGRIAMRSQEGKGTVFAIWLPVEAAELKAAVAA